LIGIGEKFVCFLIECQHPYDPENLLGAIPTMFLAFLGVQAGRILGLFTCFVY